MRMPTLDSLIFGAVAALVLALVAVMAGVGRAGPLDPAAAPGSTMRTLADIPRAWRANLSATGADPCQTERFQCVLGGAAVLDQETGLTWERTPYSGAVVTWTDAIAGCIQRSTGNRGGWRLPTISEMRTLIAAGQSTPALPPNHPFDVGTISGTGLWTASTVVTDTSRALIVVLSNGQVGSLTKTPAGSRFWCVRGADPGVPK